MRLSGVKGGDIVECDVRGRRFHATVTKPTDDGLDVRPLQSGVNYFHVSARQVLHHWRKAGRRQTATAQ